MTPPQVAYFSRALDIMIEASICAPIAAKDVKCISPITLAEKTHMEKGMTMDELHQKVNTECEGIDVATPFIAPPDMLLPVHRILVVSYNPRNGEYAPTIEN